MKHVFIQAGKTILSVVLVLFFFEFCNSGALPKHENAPIIKTESEAFPKSFCIFFESPLYSRNLVSINTDSIAIYDNSSLRIISFNKIGEQHDTLLNDIGRFKKQKNMKRLVNDIYFEIPNEFKKNSSSTVEPEIIRRLKELEFDIDFTKIKKNNNDIVFMSKNDTSEFPNIFIYNTKKNTIDTLKWDSRRSEEEIKDFFLYDFKNDGCFDIIVFSKNLIRKNLFALTIITSSSKWVCPEFFNKL